jgi:PTS system fructose-specific IIC component
MVIILNVIFGKWTGTGFDDAQKVEGINAGVMGFFGITEGAIPFAASNPKVWMPSFMIAGAIGGALAIVLGVGSNVAMWGGPIIYIAGGMGHGLQGGQAVMQTDYAWAALYFVALFAGGLGGFASLVTLSHVFKETTLRDDLLAEELEPEYIEAAKPKFPGITNSKRNAKKSKANLKTASP